MKCLVTGVVHRRGVSKKSGANFDFWQLLIALPVESVATENYISHGHGLEQRELPIDEGTAMSLAGLTYPCQADVSVESRPRGRGFETVVTGVVPVGDRPARVA